MLHPLVEKALRIPLFYKVFLANAGIVVAAVAGAVWLTRRYLTAQPELSGLVAWLSFGVGLLFVSLLANALLVRLALSPLDELERTARKVAAGDSERRAPLSPLADRDLERIIRGFNQMLDRLARYRARLRELSARSLEAQERERRRIAQELHDDTAQRLAALGLRIAVLRRKAGEGALAEELAATRIEIMDTLEELRRVARGLRPPALDELGLVAAVEVHARELREQFGLQVEVERPGTEPPLDPEAELAAYRIVQEALTNVRRHADAERVRVSFEVSEGELRIMVEDDGRGFSPTDVVEEGEDTLGLFGMKERASYVRGGLEIESVPGEGTRVTLTLSLRG